MTGRVGGELDARPGLRGGAADHALDPRLAAPRARRPRPGHELGQGARAGPVRAGLRQAARGDQRLHRPRARDLGRAGRPPRALGDRRRAAAVRRPGRDRGDRRGQLTAAEGAAAGLRWRANISLTQRPPGRSRSGAKNSSIAGVPGGQDPRALGRVDHRVEERRRGQVGDRERVADEVAGAGRVELRLEPVERRDHLGARRRGRLVARPPGSAAAPRPSRSAPPTAWRRAVLAQRPGSIPLASSSIRSRSVRSSCQASSRICGPSCSSKNSSSSSARRRSAGSAG